MKNDEKKKRWCEMFMTSNRLIIFTRNPSHGEDAIMLGYFLLTYTGSVLQLGKKSQLYAH